MTLLTVLSVYLWRNSCPYFDMSSRIKYLFKVLTEYLDIRRMRKYPERSEKSRRKKLSAILDYARANTRHYSGMESSDWPSFDVVDKRLIRKNVNDFLVSDDVRGLCHNRTSGSTGIPFSSYQDHASYLRRALIVKDIYWSLGYGVTKPSLVINVGDVPEWRDEEFKYNSKYVYWSVLIRSYDDKSFQRIYEFVKEHNIHIVRGYLSVIEYFTEYLVRTGSGAGPISLFLSMGEMLTEPVRSRIVNDLHSHVISIYGLEEVGIIGQSALDGQGDLIRLNKAGCFVELLGLENDKPVPMGQPGRVVLTDFTNKAMPLIRYDIGDMAICREALQSGEPLVIQLLECRKTDMVYSTSGAPLPMVIPFSVWTFPSVRQVQFIQEDVKKYALLINADKEIDKDSLAELVKKRVGLDAEVEIRVVDDIPVMRSGKRKMVIQNCKEYCKSV